MNYIVRCQTELLKRVINQFGLFTVVTENDGRVMFYADWLLEDIRKAQKTSKARSESGRKGLQNRYGAEKASELANTVGVPENGSLTIANENVANAIANATENGSRIDKIRTDIDIDDDCCCIRAQENFEKPLNESKADAKPLRDLLPEMDADKAWHESLVAMLPQVGVKVTAEQMPPLMNEFVQFQAARGKDGMSMTLADAKAWFFNWLMFKIEKTKKDGNNNRNCPAPSQGGTYAPSAATGYAGYRKSFAEQVRESKEKLVRDTARMLQNGELGSLGIGGGGLPRYLQP